MNYGLMVSYMSIYPLFKYSKWSDNETNIYYIVQHFFDSKILQHTFSKKIIHFTLPLPKTNNIATEKQAFNP